MKFPPQAARIRSLRQLLALVSGSQCPRSIGTFTTSPNLDFYFYFFKDSKISDDSRIIWKRPADLKLIGSSIRKQRPVRTKTPSKKADGMKNWDEIDDDEIDNDNQIDDDNEIDYDGEV